MPPTVIRNAQFYMQGKDALFAKMESIETQFQFGIRYLIKDVKHFFAKHFSLHSSPTNVIIQKQF